MVSSPNFSSQGTNVYAQLLPGSLQQKHHIVAGRDGNMTASTAQQAHLHGNLRGSQHQKSELKNAKQWKIFWKKPTLNSNAKLNDSFIFACYECSFVEGGAFHLPGAVSFVVLSVLCIYYTSFKTPVRTQNLRLKVGNNWPRLTFHDFFGVDPSASHGFSPPSMWAKIFSSRCLFFNVWKNGFLKS